MKSKTAATKTPALPKGILASDSKYPGNRKEDRVDWKLGRSGSLTLHHTERFGWCIATLPISGARSGSGYVARTYGIQVEADYAGEHKIVTVGNGPHVSTTVEIYLKESRLKELQPYIDLYNKGMENAGSIRDRIGSRRAQTSLRRLSDPFYGRW